MIKRRQFCNYPLKYIYKLVLFGARLGQFSMGLIYGPITVDFLIYVTIKYSLSVSFVITERIDKFIRRQNNIPVKDTPVYENILS